MERVRGNLVLQSDQDIEPNRKVQNKQIVLKKPLPSDILSTVGYRINSRLKKLGPLQQTDAFISPSLESKLEAVNGVLNSQRVEIPAGDFDIDSILNSAIVTDTKNLVDVSEEKKVMGHYSEVTMGNIRRSTILNADANSSDGVIYSFRQLQEYKKNNHEFFERAKADMIMQARMAQDADGCGGVNELGVLGSTGLESGNALKSSGVESVLKNNSVFGSKGHNHAEGDHEHCDHGNDFGSCSYGCKKAA